MGKVLGLEMPSGYLVRWSEVGSLGPEPRGSMERLEGPTVHPGCRGRGRGKLSLGVLSARRLAQTCGLGLHWSWKGRGEEPPLRAGAQLDPEKGQSEGPGQDCQGAEQPQGPRVQPSAVARAAKQRRRQTVLSAPVRSLPGARGRWTPGQEAGLWLSPQVFPETLPRGDVRSEGSGETDDSGRSHACETRKQQRSFVSELSFPRRGGKGKVELRTGPLGVSTLIWRVSPW